MFKYLKVDAKAGTNSTAKIRFLGKGLREAQAEADQFYSPGLLLFAGIVEADKNSKERHKQMLINMGKQRGKSLMMTAFMFKELGLPYRTPFEQAAYDEQFRTRKRVSGPELGSSLTPDIKQTRSDFDLLVAGVALLAFIILLIVV